VYTISAIGVRDGVASRIVVVVVWIFSAVVTVVIVIAVVVSAWNDSKFICHCLLCGKIEEIELKLEL
jgi:hypothetical protein